MPMPCSCPCHPFPPSVAGHEVVGILAAKGADVRGMEIGDRVGYAWIRDSCG